MNRKKYTEFQTTLMKETEQLNLSLINWYEMFPDLHNLIYRFKCKRFKKEASANSIDDS